MCIGGVRHSGLLFGLSLRRVELKDVYVREAIYGDERRLQFCGDVYMYDVLMPILHK